MNIRFIVATVILCISINTHAKRFSNSYVSFELPDNWACNIEGTEWVCVSKLNKKSKEAIIILTAKEIGPSDTYPAYLAHLQQPKLPVGKQKNKKKSKIYHAKYVNIAGHQWVDGMHYGSEVQAYITRYLATLKDRIAILVTFSAHQAYFSKYSQDFIQAINSLRVTFTGKPGIQGQKFRGSTETLGTPVGSLMGSIGLDDPLAAEPTEDTSSSDDDLFFILIIALIAIVGYLLIKPKKKKKRRKKR